MRFQQTQPSVVKGASRGDRTALALLCQWYWYPIYSFLRHLGTGPLDARDVTQGFFTRLLDPRRLKKMANVNLQPGRFRCWLRKCAKHFLLNELDRARTKKVGGGAVAISIDACMAEERFRLETRESPAIPGDGATFRVIDREVALLVIERALDKLRDRCRGAEMQFHIEQLQQGLRSDGTLPQDSDEDLAARLHTKAGNLRRNRCYVRKRFREFLREEVAAMVRDPACIDDELRLLRDAL